MNMKFKHIAAVLAGAAALSAPSCDLNEKFYSEVTPDTFFTSPASTYAVLCRHFTHSACTTTPGLPTTVSS